MLHSIATGGGSNPYTNPHDAQHVAVSFSSEAQGSVLSDFVCHLRAQPLGSCCTEDQPGSWMQVDLGAQRRMAVEYYALRVPPVEDLRLTHWQLRAKGLDGCAWELQGALAQVGPWLSLKSHVYQELVAGSSVSGQPHLTDGVQCWPVEPPQPQTAAQVDVVKAGGGGWRFLRIFQPATLQTEPGTAVLKCAGIELWGVMMDENTKSARREEAMALDFVESQSEQPSAIPTHTTVAVVCGHKNAELGDDGDAIAEAPMVSIAHLPAEGVPPSTLARTAEPEPEPEPEAELEPEPVDDVRVVRVEVIPLANPWG